MQPLRCVKRLLPALALCLTLNGCVIGAAVDLAATTVLTAGKLVVKGTGTVIDAAIPDGKKEKEKSKEKPKSEEIIYKEESSDEVTQ
ncbi:NF038104 family lipoprotein [Neisseria subflava]|uniref:NF038104 family lipoprotein n=1 Tax=Neisseria subflava TaxID=28449 RepID=UPI0020B71ACC|nr:NF038104 family lipoprotein [Neisseria subflava]UTG68113.1 NF038104 family lipoprotein [Neisseria subflava]